MQVDRKSPFQKNKKNNKNKEKGYIFTQPQKAFIFYIFY